MKPQLGVEVNRPPGLGGPQRHRVLQTPARPQAPAQVSLCSRHWGTGTLAWGAPMPSASQELGGSQGPAGGRLACPEQGLSQTAKWAEGLGRRGPCWKGSHNGRKLGSLQWGSLGAMGPACRAPLVSRPCLACLAGAGGHRGGPSGRVGTPLCQTLASGAELPCKYPRFTRFMTSLAVKFATSSTEHTGRGTDRNRERD